MQKSTRSNKEQELILTDPARLERSIRKSKKLASIDAPTSTSTDLDQHPSTDTNTSTSTEFTQDTSLDTHIPASIDGHLRDNMVATLILVRDENGNLHDTEGHLRNAAGRKIDDQGTEIPDQDGADAATAQPGANAQAAQMTLADYNRPDQFYANRSAIRPPPFQRNDFEIKPAYFDLVARSPYHGLRHEHPMDHLERFEDLVTAIKANGVPHDYLFCKLFKYSLAGEAAYWLKQLAPGSLTSWNEIKNAFLRNFFDDARVEDLRSKIATFSQDPSESFRDAWMRFKSYQRDCPHHGFNEVQLLSTFSRGIGLQYQMALDTASEGNFSTRSPEEATKLIENLASSNSTKNTDYEKKKSTPTLNREQMEEVRAKLDSVHKFLHKKVSFAEVEAVDSGEEDNEEEDVNYIGGSGFQRQGNQGYNRNSYGQRSNFNQGSQQKPSYNNNRTYGSSYYQNIPPETQESKIEAMVDRVLEGQQKMTVDFNGKIDGLYLNLNTKFENLSTHVKKLESQVLQTSDTIRRHEDLIKDKMESGMRHHVNALLDDDFWQEIRKENLQEGDFRVESSMSFGSSHWCRSTGTSERRSTEPTAASVASCESANIARRKLHNVDRCRHTDSDRQQAGGIDRSDRKPNRLPSINANLIDRSATTTSDQSGNTSGTMDTDIPDGGHSKRKKKIPKHERRKATEEEIDNFTKRVLRIPLDISFDEAYYTHRLWIFFRETRETDEDMEVMFNHLRKKMKERTCLEKKSDPGKFIIPCFIKGKEYPNALCDTGSAVSIMPRTMAEELNLKIEPSKDSFTFVDCSKTNSGGMVKDVLVQINNTFVPVDFHVIDIMVEWNSSLLLGRAFMATVGAICDMQSNRLCLSLINDKVYYETYKNKPALSNFRDDAELVAACFCSYDHDEESDGLPSIDTQPRAPIDVYDYRSIDSRERRSIDTPISDPTYNHQADFEYGSKHSDEREDEDYWEEQMFEYRGIREEEAEVYQVSYRHGNTRSIDGDYIASIDTEEKEEFDTESAVEREREYGYIEPDRFGILRDSRGRARAMDGRILRVAEADIAEILAMTEGAQNLCNRCNTQEASIDAELRPSIDTNNQTEQNFKEEEIDVGLLKPDEFGVFRDDKGFARALDGRKLHISKEDVAEVLIMAGGSDNVFNQQKKEPASIDVAWDASIDVSRRNEKADYLASIDARHRASIDVNVPERNRFCTANALGSESSRSSGWINPLLIDGRVEFGKRAYHNGKRIFRWEKKDEYGIWRDEEGNARAIDGRIVNVQEIDIRAVLERANMMEQSIICLPEHASEFVLKKQESYSKMEMDEKIKDLYQELEEYKDDFRDKMDDHHYRGLELGDRMSRLEEDFDELLGERLCRPARVRSIDGQHAPSIDAKTYSREEIDEIVQDIYKAQEMSHDESYNRLNDVYYPLDKSITDVATRMCGVEKEIEKIKEQIAMEPPHLKSIDANTGASIDGEDNQKRIGFVTEDIMEKKLDDINFSLELMKEDLNEQIKTNSEYADAGHNIHQRRIGYIMKRMRSVERSARRLKAEKQRTEEAFRSFMSIKFMKTKEEVDTCFPSVNNQH